MTSFAKSLPPIYAAGLLRLALPLVALPIVAARLGASDFGRVSFILVWASLLSTLVEGGFLAAATRLAVADDAPRRRQLAQKIFSARVVLCVPVVALAMLASAWAGEGGFKLVDAAWIAATACALGWPATWYLQATQQLGRWAWVEVAVYAALLALTLSVVHSVTAYLALQLAASLTLSTIGWLWIWRDVCRAPGVGLWSPAQVAPGLRLGWTMLPVGIAGAAYSYALPAVASSQLSKPELGLYFMADRMVRAVLAAADPIFSVVYPRIVRLFDDSARRALAYAARWALGGLIAGAALWLAAFASWPWFEPFWAARASLLNIARLHAVLLVLSALWPILLGWRFFGYWMLGSGRYDAAYRACIVIGGAAGLIGAFVAGGTALGLAWTAIGVECLVIFAAVSGIRLTGAKI